VPELVLDEIAPALRPVPEELLRVFGLGNLAEHEHADRGVGGAKIRCDPETFVGQVGRHADVRNDDVRLLLLHGLPQGLQIPALADDVDVVLTGEDPRDPLAREVAVVCDQDADRHRSPSR
jgi:hypothetical protein